MDKQFSKDTKEYKSPNCKVIILAAMNPFLQASYGKFGAAGADVDVDDDNTDY